MKACAARFWMCRIPETFIREWNQKSVGAIRYEVQSCASSIQKNDWIVFCLPSREVNATRIAVGRVLDWPCKPDPLGLPGDRVAFQRSVRLIESSQGLLYSSAVREILSTLVQDIVEIKCEDFNAICSQVIPFSRSSLSVEASSPSSDPEAIES